MKSSEGLQGLCFQSAPKWKLFLAMPHRQGADPEGDAQGPSRSPAWTQRRSRSRVERSQKVKAEASCRTSCQERSEDIALALGFRIEEESYIDQRRKEGKRGQKRGRRNRREPKLVALSSSAKARAPETPILACKKQSVNDFKCIVNA